MDPVSDRSCRVAGRILSRCYGAPYLVIQRGSYRGWWRQADSPVPGQDDCLDAMSLLIMVPLIAIAAACAAIPVFGG